MITVTTCKYCHNEIEWRQQNGKNVLYNIDGTQHTRQKCEQMQKLASLSHGDGISKVRDMLGKVLKNDSEELRFRVGEYECLIRKVM